MVYALFMLAILLVLRAMWRGRPAALPLFLLTFAVVSVFLILDMTSPLTLSF
jgi:hypothetical protein